jgi:hypothetical protein
MRDVVRAIRDVLRAAERAGDPEAPLVAELLGRPLAKAEEDGRIRRLWLQLSCRHSPGECVRIISERTGAGRSTIYNAIQRRPSD